MKTPEEIYEEQRQIGNTEYITGNPAPNYSLPFYQNIFLLMEEYAAQPTYKEKVMDILKKLSLDIDKFLVSNNADEIFGLEPYAEQIRNLASLQEKE